MKIVAFAAALSLLLPSGAAAQNRRAPGAAPAATPRTADRTAEAYEQFLRARSLREDDVPGAIAAYQRATLLDPASADIPADLADLYMEEGRPQEAMTAAEQALRISETNRTAHRVLGMVYAQMVGGANRGGRQLAQDALPNAIRHLEQAIEQPPTIGDFSPRAVLARLYLASRNYDKAISVLPDLIKIGWQEGAGLLVDAYAGAGRSADAVKWLEEAAPDNPELYRTLGDFYARDRRWVDSASAYEQALRESPRSFDLRVLMASSLLQSDSMADLQKGRDVLREALTIRGTDERALYLLSQAERRTGDSRAAEAAARRLIVQNAKNPRGYFALAEALEEQRRFQAVVDALVPAVATFDSGNDIALGLLLPHLGFAYEELGQFDKAVSAFENARTAVPDDPAMTIYLIQAQLGAKKYSAAAELAHSTRSERPGDLRLARLESVALRRGGKVDQGLAILEDLVRTQPDQSDAYVALAQAYMESNRAPQAAKLLREAQSKFPDDAEIGLQLGASLDKQKKFAESEAVLRQLIAANPENATALNYLGYMLAERGERLTESVDFIKRALAIDPDNGSYLDSIGWAYFKDGKLTLAFDNLKRAADLLGTNSVVQDHYGDVLFKMGRYDEAITAWNRALVGDGESIERSALDKKIKSARQKLPRR
jgi:tetratricopeptide (TPR) repeat protein